LNDEVVLDLGNRKVLIRNFGQAHSAGDLIVYDYNSKIYFVGDIIFRHRAAAFSDANIKNWRNKIEFFSKSFWNFIVPGHGSVIAKHADISDTSEWLKFLHNSIMKAMKNGDTTSEITQYKIPRSIENLKFINSTLQQGLKRQLENFSE
jgi:glyoxylase-like metal-dependent hydrolase (beta-lactamase superfamily II)